jgi:hypothetical protein
MATNDMETVKQFLMERNNRGELNIEKLCLVGADLGATVALNWAAIDWSWPQLATGKQGQDVKAIITLSPDWSFKGLTVTKALEHPAVRSQLSMLIFVGKADAKALESARRIYNRLQRFHAVPKDQAAQEDLFLREVPTSLQGTKMLGQDLGIEKRIAGFIDLRLARRRFPWNDRTSPLAK